MKRKLLFTTGMVLIFTSLFAQTPDNAIKEINAIKANSDYISAESTVKDWETAYENAKILLSKEIEQWLIEHGASNIAGVVAMSNDHILEIKTTRGSLYRAFVYISKSDLYPFVDKSKLMIVDIAGLSDSVPTAILADSSASADNTEVILTAVEKDMLSITEASGIKPFVQGKIEAERIESYGKYSTLPKEGCSYIFIYDQEGNVPACLRYEGGVAINLATGKEEIISENYKGCGGIWFKLK